VIGSVWINYCIRKPNTPLGTKDSERSEGSVELGRKQLFVGKLTLHSPTLQNQALAGIDF
jgi:hypothetical protein